MEIKIKRLDVIQAAKNLELVERLPRGTLEQFCRVFKVSEGGNDLGGLIKGFQGKIADIICQQGEGYEDYLQLPRFKVMGQELNQRMNLLFRKVWEEYRMLCKREQINLAKRQFQQIAPTFQNTDDTVQFHLGMLQLYRSSSLCPRKSQKGQKRQQQHRQSSNQNNNFINPSPNPNPNGNIQNTMSVMGTVVGQNIFPYFPFPPPNTMAKVEAQEGMNYILESKQNQPLFDMSRFTMQSNYPPQQPIEFYSPIDTKQLFVQKKVENQQIKKQKSQGLFTQNSSFLINKKFNNYPFVQCVCQGEKGFEDGFSFKCLTCSYLYHYNCLRTQGSIQQVLACPLCLLRKQTIFCQVFREPLKFSWFFQENQGQDLKIKLNMLQTNEVFEARKKGYQCQIRFLKIDGKSFKKEKKPLDGFTTEGGILLKQPKHSEIVLPQMSQDKKQPISIQIMLKSDNDRDNAAKLYFFAVFITNIKSVADIVKDVFESDNAFSLDYYYQFMGNSDKIQVNLNNNSIIKFPVRGANCRHAGVFDLITFLNFNFDFKKQNLSELLCSICSQPCQTFKYDSFIYNCIKNFPQYEKKRPQAIQIQRNGEYAWVLQNPPIDKEESSNKKHDAQSPQSQRFMIDDPESEQSNSQQ